MVTKSIISILALSASCLSVAAAEVKSDIEYGRADDVSLKLDVCIPDLVSNLRKDCIVVFKYYIEYKNGAADAHRPPASESTQELTMTQRYMHLSPAALDAAIRLLDGPKPTYRVGEMMEAAGNRP